MQNISTALTSPTSWQDALKQAFTEINALCSFLELEPDAKKQVVEACQQFPLRVPREYAQRIEKNNPLDPLLLQVLPRAAEMSDVPGYVVDPLQEQQYNPHPGLLQKYHGRVLITLTSRCAIHCRYCFRRHFPYEDNNPGSEGRELIFSEIENDRSIREVILSGGDPLVANDKLIVSVMDRLARIPHVDTCRFHTRLPIVIPQRITDELLQTFNDTKLNIVMVYHINHANEIDDAVYSQCQRLRAAGVTLLNQSVLLHGINDDSETLIALSNTLFSAGILPYYLHLCDKTQGTAHFDVSESRAQVIMQEMRSQLPGYLVPRCVREIPGGTHKSPLSESHVF